MIPANSVPQNRVVPLQAPAQTLKPAVAPSSTPEEKDQVQLSQPQLESKPAAPVRVREARGEMAEMLENMQSAEERLRRTGNDVEKAIREENLLTRGMAHSPLVMLDEPPAHPTAQDTKIDGWVADLHKEHGAHPPKENLGLLGGHLGLEGGEHIAHDLMHAKAELAHTALSESKGVAQIGRAHV